MTTIDERIAAGFQRVADELSALRDTVLTRDSAGKVDYSELPVGLTFSIFADGAGGWRDANGAPVTARPPTATDMQMLIFGGSTMPSFALDDDVLFAEP